MQHVGYLQQWLLLARAQKRTLRIVSEEPIGFELSAAALRQQIESSLATRIPGALSLRFHHSPELISNIRGHSEQA